MMKNVSKAFLWLGLGLMAPILTQAASKEAQPPLDFNRDIRPILSDNCFACHGPDENKRKGKHRLDTKEGAFAKIEDRVMIVPGNKAGSEVFRRITTHDEDDHMPPAKSGKKLTEKQVGMIGRWIDQGAPWTGHWAFDPLQRPPVPKVKTPGWTRNPIDNFVLARLEKEGVQPSPEADRPALARRVSLDLNGLPPTIEEVDAFLADSSTAAYDKLVDRLLTSARYGEQMGRYWLDAARYADTHGYHIDSQRDIYFYREWVINAFNKNLPFDQFTIEQLAGDLLPNPTAEQKIATGFHRCTMTTGEGGAIEEEYLAKYAMDRVETTSTVWLGLTMTCAQCHNHKYDPLTQTEYYQFFAFFNGIAEPALDGNKPNPEPFLKVPSRAQAEKLAQLRLQINEDQARLDAPMTELDPAQIAWERKWSEKLRGHWSPLEPGALYSNGGASLRKLDDLSILAAGENPDKDVYEVVARTDATRISALRLEALTHESLPHKSASRSDNGNFILTEFEVEAAPAGQADKSQTIKFAAAYADFSQSGFDIAKAIDGKKDSGWAVDGATRREDRTVLFVAKEPFGFEGGTELRIRLKHEASNAKHTIGRFRLSFTTAGEPSQFLASSTLSGWQAIGPFKAADGKEAYEKAFEPEQEIDLARTYQDGQLKWEKKPDFADGKVQNLTGENSATYLYRTITAPAARQMTLSLGSDDAIKVWVNGNVVLDKNVQRAVEADQEKVTIDLKPGENQLLMKVVNYGGSYGFYFSKLSEETDGLPPQMAQVFALAGNRPGKDQQKQLRDYFRRSQSPEWSQQSEALVKVREQEKKLDGELPTTLVMREMEKPRETFLLKRGQYDQKGQPLTAGVPAVLPPLPEGAPTNRLGLAKWLVDPAHPLTARVIVNRFWQQYFGTGIVKTVEDFGVQGEQPSHPELLDWLATEFISSGWDMKHIQRLIVASATYRQASRLTPQMLEKDPQNRLFTRGSRFRMDAEMVRDSALAISGLLVERVGGRSVKPYQPPGLWESVSYGFNQKWVQDKDDANYRRTLYTFWKRQSPPPNLLTMDMPTRETCAVRRPRTNTPLQALLLMNDPQFVEAARALAQRLMVEGRGDSAQRVAYAFRLATGRTPRPDETKELVEHFNQQLDEYRRDQEAATKLLSVGDFKRNESLDVSELAAWMTVASIILNLDETMTKG